MKVTVLTDQGPLQLDAPATLQQALQALLHGRDPELVASAVNGRFVPRGQRAGFALKDGDCVQVFSPITGG
ncbi:sulfur carrier protein ThiS [Inhella proteolytica]|uniref:Sulfur carrier protein ThiS n=1 Tax=Inhella proteolytica TaxID=2795029 RepID=A0A931NGZ9_9BURK|nr:sulfur carrier protein ThiS [Inhella proteolytica]MBH9577218.1 sulfur carrier protein ThiS [Inhella proteolytica]